MADAVNENGPERVEEQSAQSTSAVAPAAGAVAPAAGTQTEAESASANPEPREGEAQAQTSDAPVTDRTEAPSVGADAASPGGDAAAPGSEAPEASGTTSKEKEGAPDEAPKFRPQHEEEIAPDERRPIGWSNPVREPSETSKNPDAAFLMGSRMTAAFDGHPGVEPFTGKRMVIKLGLGSKYVFDGDKVPKALKHGRGSVRGEDAPIDIVVGNAKDVNNKRQAEKKNQLLSDDRAMDIQAMALQATVVLKAREEGSKDPVLASDVVKGRFGEGAGIIAERIDALSPEDLKIMSESRIRDLSHAAQRMMVYGVPTKDLGRASEMVSKIEEGAPEIAGDPKEGQESKAAAGVEGSAPEAGAPSPGPTPAAAEPGAPTADGQVAAPAAANDPTTAANDDRVAKQADVVGVVQAEATQAAQDASVREKASSIMDQARSVVADDATTKVQPKGPEAANDPSAALLAAAARNARSRD